MVGAGTLTRWQARKLLAGKKSGFYLGRYRLLRPLGKGGMGVVYLGEHHVMKRLMALKILSPEAVKDPRRIERFKEEARAAALLDHPNIVRAYDFAEAGGKLYIVMEYIDGIDLHQAVARDGTMKVESALNILFQATGGLTHAHDRGIIHRDIKPSNLLLRTDGVVKITDMGLARIGWAGDNDPKSQKRLMGTADFIAPEQVINNQGVDARADIYSLGCTFFFLLAGKTPFSGESISQRLAKHQTLPSPDIRTFRSDCPPAIAELLTRMMSKRPEDRPNSATELMTWMKQLGAGKSVTPIAPAGDTIVDGSFYQATIDDSSLSSDGEVVVAEVEEFDFDSLPPIDLGTQVPVPRPAQLPAKPMPKSGKKQAITNSAVDAQQQVLLGAGLTLAIIALLATLGISGFLLIRSPSDTQQKIKQVEQGKGGHVIVVGQNQ
jgi:serine/threonine-protein kinase